MTYIRAFISGIVVPSVILPFVVCLGIFYGKEEILRIPFFHFLPVLWGVWNMIYFAFLRELLPGGEDAKLLLSGAILGLIVALIGVYWLRVPYVIGLTGNAVYFPLVVAPILYAIIWRYLVKPLNYMTGLT